ncbi:MAG: adenine phosphoribosyltransferase [Bdellovibrionales bacterium]|nr:adenine phosphoribosyltransferase [Bdellovibrionales bacterium]
MSSIKNLKNKAAELFHENLITVQDWPKEGVEFLDMLKTVTYQPLVNQAVIECFVDYYKNKKIDAIAGVEARGLIFGAQLSYAMKLPFIPVRKPGKLPPPVISIEYDLEYGSDVLEVEVSTIKQGMEVLLFDDVIATGGTAIAAYNLLTQAGASLNNFAFIVEISELPWREKIPSGVEVFTVTKFPRDKI